MGFLYGCIALISLYVRNFVLPNPFTCFGDFAVVVNWIAEPFLHAVAFALVGLVYQKGSAPALGSFLYLVTYAALVGALLVMSIFEFAWWWNLIVFVGIVSLLTAVNWVCNRLSDCWY